jgi:CBS domain
VYHYLRGKADWMVRGLPMEPAPPLRERMRALPYFINNFAPRIRAGWIIISRRETVSERMRRDVPAIAPADPVPEFKPRAGMPGAVVLDADGILLGAIEQAGEAARAVDAMNPEPQTIRPDMTPRLAIRLLRRHPYILITTTSGRYLGRYAPPAAGES